MMRLLWWYTLVLYTGRHLSNDMISTVFSKCVSFWLSTALVLHFCGYVKKGTLRKRFLQIFFLECLFIARNSSGKGSSVRSSPTLHSATICNVTLIARFMGPTWGPSGADRTQVGPCWPHEICYLGTYPSLAQSAMHHMHAICRCKLHKYLWDWTMHRKIYIKRSDRS